MEAIKSILIEPDGTMVMIWDDEHTRALAAAGTAQTRRASHVEPTADSQWLADMGPVGGPVMGPYATRREAIAAEVHWIEQHILSSDPPTRGKTHA